MTSLYKCWITCNVLYYLKTFQLKLVKLEKNIYDLLYDVLKWKKIHYISICSLNRSVPLRGCCVLLHLYGSKLWWNAFRYIGISIINVNFRYVHIYTITVKHIISRWRKNDGHLLTDLQKVFRFFLIISMVFSYVLISLRVLYTLDFLFYKTRWFSRTLKN